MAKITRAIRVRQLDKQLADYKGLLRPSTGYIHAIREALGMNVTQLAARMGMSHAGVINIEHSEAEETISLKTLNKAAEALDCKLVYALVPKTSLQQQVTEQARKIAISQAEGVFRSMGLEQQSTTPIEQEELIEELTQAIIQKGGRELWK